MNLDELLIQNSGPVINTAPQINTQEEKKEDIGFTEEANGLRKVYFGANFEREFVDDLVLLEKVQARINEKKEKIKDFIEANDLGSFKTDLVNVKYTSATTATTIDTAKLKKELPDIAAKYSKVSSRKSSVSVDLIETDTLAKDLMQL